MVKYKFFENKDSQIIFTGNYMEFYIPKYYFTNEVASMVGSSVRSLGIFHFGVFSSAEKNKPEEGTIYSLQMPLDINLNFRDEYDTTKKLKDTLPSESYRVFTLNKGDVFIEQDTLMKDVGAVDKFVNKLLHAGKLPKDLNYSDILGIYLQCLHFNDFNFGVPSLTLESVVSEIYRDKSDVSKPFRQKIGKGGNTSELSYEAYRIDSIPSLNSTFAAVTFENMNQAVIESVLRNRDGKEETSTPVEDMLYY